MPPGLVPRLSGLHRTGKSGKSVSMIQWYYGENGQQAGPVEEREFHRLVAIGTITPTTLVWREGLPNWMPYGQTGGDSSVQFTPVGMGGYQMMVPTTSGLAISSLVCGILGLVTCFVLLGIPAVILGHMALRQIANAPFVMVGRGMAIGGLVCGYLCVLVMLSFVTVLIIALASQM